jgi:monoamine oxidase
MKFAAPRGFRQSDAPNGKNSDTMLRFSRRSFLAASAAALVAPALAASDGAEVDVVIVGAGAAGIAAARRVAAARRSFRLYEAGKRIGGRCATDTQFFGVPFDLGAHWIHNPDSNPLRQLAPKDGFDLYPAPRGEGMRVGPRPARDAELENFLAALVRARRAIAEPGRGKTDVAAATLPRDLGDWRATIEFVLGPYTCGKDLAQVSAADFARQAERYADAFCRQGYGALLARLGTDLSVQLNTPVDAIAWSRNLGVDTPKGNILARAVIVTASTNALLSDKIEFIPPLPKRQLDAAAKLALGSYDNIGLEMPGNPLGLQRDDLVFEKSSNPRTAALLANVSGTGLHVLTVAGGFGRELSANGEAAMIDFAGDWLASLFGSRAKRAIKRSRATRWNDEPFVLGGFSVAAPGADDARRTLREPVGGRIWFAGEAVHDTQWGTVAGAWEAGTLAAEAVLRHIGALKEPAEEKPARHPREQPPRRSRGKRKENG